MLGTIINFFSIVAGALLGVIIGKRFSKRYSDIIMQAIGLAVVLIGLLSAIKTELILLLIASMGIGSILGEFIKIEEKLEQIAEKMKSLMKSSHGNFVEGFVTSTLIYCVGSMAIIGAIESGIKGDHTTLIIKSILDGVSAIIFAASFGIGVVFSAVSVFIYQGSITLLAGSLADVISKNAIRELSAVGGLIIMAIGMNILGITKIKVGNMLPAIFIPVIYYAAKSLYDLYMSGGLF